MDNSQTTLGREVFESQSAGASASTGNLGPAHPVRESRPTLLQPPFNEIHPDLRIGAGEAEAQPHPTTKHRVRRLLLVGAGLAALAGGGYFGRDYWMVGRFEVSTDDAYVQADTRPSRPRCRAISPRCWSPTTRRSRRGRRSPGSTTATSGRGRSGQGRCRGRRGDDRQQAGGARRGAVGDRGRARHGRGRPANQTFAEQEEQALRDAGATGSARCRTPSRLPPHRRPTTGSPARRRDAGRRDDAGRLLKAELAQARGGPGAGQACSPRRS